MGILLTIFYIGLFLYSVFWGFILMAEYFNTPINAKNEKEEKEKFSKANIIFLKKLIKYTLIVSIPAYFWEDLMDLVGSSASIEGDYYLGLLAMPIFIWANTLIIMICLVLDFFPKKIKSFLKKK